MESVVEQKPPGEVSQGASNGGANTHFIGVLFCFVLSGFAALLYQTAWLRQFSIVFGTSELAVATVLAAYMAGLALGAVVGGKLVTRMKRPVLTYGLLELGIAVGALLVPLGLNGARSLQTALIGGQAEIADAGGTGQSIFFLLVAFAIIMIPTTFMGATLPLLTRHAVRRDSQIGTRVGMLYTMNTAGAVAGTLVAAFVLLPAVGLSMTVYVGVAVNALVFLIAAGIAKGSAPIDDGGAVAEDVEAEEDTGPRGSWILPLILVSGITSFTYEVLWTRLLSQVLGGSVYAFATMLASFLIGITLGSAVASIFSRTRKGAAIGFVVAQLGIAFMSIFVWAELDGLPARFMKLEAANDGGGLSASALVAALVLLPAALCIGATFPFALRVLARKSKNAGQDSARVYSWNTVGAIVGAVLAGFFLIPSLGFDGAVRAAVATNLILALLAALIFLRSQKGLVAVTAIALLGGLAAFQPQIPLKLLRHSSFGLPAEGKIVHMAVGRSATVMAIEQDGYYEIRSNGLPEALVTPKGAPPFGKNSPYYLSLIPVIARPQAKSMMVIGFGGGVTLESVPPSIETVDAIELEPEIIVANKVFSDQRAVNPFNDPRLNLIHNDARGALAVTDEQWDIIVSQPSHPWTAGASHLYTREFLELVKQHLNEDGVFVQWMNARFLDEELFGSLGNTLMDAFENVRLYRPISYMLIFVASDGPLDVEREVARTGLPMSAHPAWWARLGLYDVNDIAALLALEQDGLRALCGDAPISTDDANLLAMRADPKKAQFKNNDLMGFLFPQDPLLNVNGSLSKDLEPFLDRGYIATKWANSDLLRRAMEGAKVLEPNSGERFRAEGMLKASVMFSQWAAGHADFVNALRVDPTNMASRYLVLRDTLPIVASLQDDEATSKIIAGQLGGGAGTVYLGWEHTVNGRWEALKVLDADLAQVRARDPWFIESIRLRAEWRLRLPGNENQRKAWAVEALRLIDTGLVLEPNPFLLLQRADASLFARRPRFLVETLDALADYVGPRHMVLPPSAVSTLATELRRRAQVLDQLRGTGAAEGWRITQVQEKIVKVLAEHDQRVADAHGQG